MFCQICQMTWFNGYSLICQPMDYSDNDDAQQLIKMGYIYSVSKLIDFVDTIRFAKEREPNNVWSCLPSCVYAPLCVDRLPIYFRRPKCFPTHRQHFVERRRPRLLSGIYTLRLLYAQSTKSIRWKYFTCTTEWLPTFFNLIDHGDGSALPTISLWGKKYLTVVQTLENLSGLYFLVCTGRRCCSSSVIFHLPFRGIICHAGYCLNIAF